jgi:hypothetical protein
MTNSTKQPRVKAASQPSVTPTGSGLLQRKCACGGAAGMSGVCEKCSKKKRFGLQSKLKINEPGDIHERQADRVVDQVMATPAHPAVSGATPRIQRFPGQSNAQMDAAPASVDQALGSPGKPLEPALRQDMEQRFGHDFSRVRVHSGAAAEQSARDINAHAYTVGHNMVFGAGRFAPGTHEGRRLLAHELTHVVQQLGARPSGPSLSSKLQRQPAGGATQPVSSGATKGVTWKDLWPDFKFARISRTTAHATAIAKELAEAPRDFDDLLEQGFEVVDWLQSHGEPEVAARLLDAVRANFTFAWATDQPLPAIVMGDVFTLQGNPIKMAEDAARNGKHDEAFKLFGIAHEILSFYALQTTERRQAEDLSRGMAYLDLEKIYDQMRKIYEFYYVLEREALLAGDTGKAAIARTKAAELVTELRREYSPSAGVVEVAEASSVTTAKGPALRLEGANAVTTDLTMLPGLTSTKEIGAGIQLETLDVVQNALIAQAGLQAEIGREPEIRKAFGNTPIDLNDTQQRQKVWRIMYSAYSKAGPGALGRLMALIGKYLKAFTTHTSYNIRDFGANYLDSKFSTDLARRVEMDCGVYALSVAWDAYQAVKQSGAKGDVTFRLVAFLDHVSLIIDDKTGAESYVVNNNNITPIKADPEREAQKEYGEMRGFSHLITPSYFYNLGSTKDSASKFRAGVWARYLKAVSEIGLKQTALEKHLKKTKGGGTAFGVQKLFSEDAAALDALVNELAPFANDPHELAARLDSFMPLAIEGGALFTLLAKSFKPFDKQHQFTYHWPGTAHPLVRVALVLLRIQKLGGKLTQDQQRYLKFSEGLLKEELDKHRQDGEAGRF